MPWVPVVSMALSGLAALAHAWAVFELRRSTQPHAATWRFMSQSAGMLAGIYSLAYAWLIFGDVERGQWSMTLQWVTLAAWSFVWILPGINTAWVARKATERFKS